MKLVVFAPHAGIWPHAFPEALVADAVRTAGAEVVYITCGGALASGCVTMASKRVPPSASEAERRAVCAACMRSRDALRGGFAFGGYDLDSVLTPDDEARITQILDGVAPDAIAALEVDCIAIGSAALYEFLIERKKLQLALTPEEWTAFRPRLANTLRSLIAAQRVLDREQPDRVAVYNSLYSVNAAWRLVAAARRIPFYFVHGGLSLERRLQRVLIGRDTTLDWWMRAIAAWPAFRDVPCTGGELAEVTNHFLQLFRGTSVFAYSAPKAAAGQDVRAKFGVRSEQKLLVASMSSYDEYVAAAAVGGAPDPKGMLFPTQLAWAQALIEWARRRPDCFVLLRVHPREFPNKREGRKSEHATLLEAELAQLPDNVRVNWPTDELSIYDVAEEADVFLNAWSTAGKEMSVFGFPVVTFCPEAIPYPADLNYVGTTHATYFAAIEDALRDGWSFERIRRGYRWCVLEYVRGLVDIGDAFGFEESAPRSLLERGWRAILSQPPVRRRYDLLRRPRVLAAQARIGELFANASETLLETRGATRDQAPDVARETLALRRELRRLVNALYRGASPRPGTLHARFAAAAL